METVKEILGKLTLAEKVSLLVGHDFWHTNAIKRLGLPPIVVSDGPFGLRKVENQGAGPLETSRPATAFPTSSALASSFNDDLLSEIGHALALECIDQGVDVLLGPGLNIKRNPLCGRNFEYYSEDPYLSGRLSTALVKSIEKQGIGTSVKHFAVNNQEDKRLMMNAIVDERALFEIYLRGFEMVIKDAKPMTVMCSYNQINGTHASRNKKLLIDILRNKFGYQGLVVSDWGAVVELSDSVKSGLNLEMPGRRFSGKKLAKELLKAGVKESQIDEAISPLLQLMIMKKYRTKRDHTISYGDHHNLAVKAATESAVLLKNEQHILPLSKKSKLALIGAFAKNPRYQGSGSSRINPMMLENVFDIFSLNKVNFNYAPGYDLGSDLVDQALIDEALNVVSEYENVVVMVGLPDEFEMEGMDREHLELPKSHNELVEALINANKNVIVVLSSGAPVTMPWLNRVKAVLHLHLAGQGNGQALYQLLFGEVVPSGKLAETYPLKLEDVPSYKHFGQNRLNVEYRESIYVGYRYYEKSKKEVLFPFGFGLSYTNFTYKSIEISDHSFAHHDQLKVVVTVRNSGKYDGQEVVQLYTGPRKQVIFAAPLNLVNFKKVLIKAGEEVKVEFTVTKNDFSIYDMESKTFQVDDGTYTIFVGCSSRDLKLSRMVKIESDFSLADRSKDLPNYYEMSEDILDVPFSQFAQLFDQRIEHYHAPAKRPYSAVNCLNDVRMTFVGRLLIKQISKMIKEMSKGNPLNEKLMLKAFLDTPIRSYSSFSGGAISKRQINGLVRLLNLRFISGALLMIPSKEQRKLSKQNK